MGKSETLKSIKAEWLKLRQTVESTPNYTRDLPGAEGLWSITDCLKHVAGWDEEVIDVVCTFIESGAKRETGGAEEINDRLLEDRKHMDASETWGYFQTTHLSLISYLESLPEHVFDLASHTGHWIGYLVPQHYKDHREDIQTTIESITQ